MAPNCQSSEEVIEVDMLVKSLNADSSFDTNKVARASVASELEFNNENASLSNSQAPSSYDYEEVD